MSSVAPERITVRVPNNKMKRSTSRESPPIRKRRASLGRYDGSSDERMSPERMRRRHGSPRYASPPREKYAPLAHTFKVLCVSAIHPKASDDYVKEALYHEYKKFGDFNIRLSIDESRERIAYVCFRTSEDARAAKSAKPRVVIYDKVAIVEPVYETIRGRGRSKSPPPEYDRYYGRGSPERRRAHYPPEHHPYERYPPSSMHHPPEFRPVMHSEYMSPRGPPMHSHRGGPHHYAPRPYMPRAPRVPYDKNLDNKKDKFPNYLHHVPPEEDPLATRTLFAGNLEINISDEEMKRIFGKYGIVEDIDIKRPPPGTGNAFAFVRYQNLDMAHRAKVNK